MQHEIKIPKSRKGITVLLIDTNSKAKRRNITAATVRNLNFEMDDTDTKKQKNKIICGKFHIRYIG